LLQRRPPASRIDNFNAACAACRRHKMGKLPMQNRPLHIRQSVQIQTFTPDLQKPYQRRSSTCESIQPPRFTPDTSLISRSEQLAVISQYIAGTRTAFGGRQLLTNGICRFVLRSAACATRESDQQARYYGLLRQCSQPGHERDQIRQSAREPRVP